MFLVFIKSYRDNTVDVETLKTKARIFSDFFRAETYKHELDLECGGWIETDLIEIQES